MGLLLSYLLSYILVDIIIHTGADAVMSENGRVGFFPDSNFFLEHISQIPSTISSQIYVMKISDNKTKQNQKTETEEEEINYFIKKSPKGYRPTWYLKHAICRSSLVSNY